MERILGTPCNKLGVNVFSFSPPLTSVPRSLFRGFSSHFRTSLDFLVPEKMWADHTEISNEYFWSLATILQNPDKPIQTQSRPLLSGDENYKYVDISTFQRTHNWELGRNSCLSLLVASLSWKLFLACIKGQFAGCRRQTGGRVVLL